MRRRIPPDNRDVARRFRHLAPERLQIRQGGGWLALFGLPFFLAGIFMMLVVIGVVPISNGGEQTAVTWIVLAVLSVPFTAVGAALTFGRSWIIVDSSQRTVVKQWGLLVPMHQRAHRLDGYTAVILGFVPGDSDTSESFPLALKARTGADLPLCSFSTYPESWECAAAVAQHLRIDIEDATTDHPVSVSPDTPGLSPRRSRDRIEAGVVSRPAGARSEVHREADQVRIVIPHPRTHPIVLVFMLIPLAVPVFGVPMLLDFFRHTNTPGAIGWVFIGFLTLFFGILPGMTVVNGLLRERRGSTTVLISRQGLQLLERGAWRTRTLASFARADIVDVDYSTRDSALASSRRATEQQVLQSGRWTATDVGPRTERVLAAVSRFVKGRGLTVKTRRGLTMFGAGLDDDETQYLHSVIRQELERN